MHYLDQIRGIRSVITTISFGKSSDPLHNAWIIVGLVVHELVEAYGQLEFGHASVEGLLGHHVLLRVREDCGVFSQDQLLELQRREDNDKAYDNQAQAATHA